MKRCLTVLLALLLLTLPATAGAIPESLLHSDDALVFFGEVLSYHPDVSVEVSTVKTIKGDVVPGVGHYAKPSTVGDFNVVPGYVYLFTYLDENNPTEIFEVTSYDTAELKLRNTTGDMWERFEEYLNNGEYEKAEAERLERLGRAEELTEQTDPENLQPMRNPVAPLVHWLIWNPTAAACCGALILLVVAAVVGFVVCKRRKRR